MCGAQRLGGYIGVYARAWLQFVDRQGVLSRATELPRRTALALRGDTGERPLFTFRL